MASAAAAFSGCRSHKSELQATASLKEIPCSPADVLCRRYQLELPSSPAVTPFKDPLRIPPVLKLKDGDAVTIAMTQLQVQLHSELGPAQVWGYRGSHPGPTIEVQRGSRISVHWQNQLPSKHLFAVDHTLHGASENTPEVRTVVHVHGLKTLPEYDGYPEAWFTNGNFAGPSFKPGPYLYANDQPAATLWYHDHAIGITRLNMYAGLSGAYLIRDDVEKALGLPEGDFDIPLILQDRIVSERGKLIYPTISGTHPQWMPEFFGDRILVNGGISPYCEVEARQYRFRFINSSNSRFYRIHIVESDSAGQSAGRACSFHQISSDTALLPRSIELQSLLLAPAERAAIIVDFLPYAGRSLMLVNDAPAPYPSGGQSLPSKVLLCKVKGSAAGNEVRWKPALVSGVAPQPGRKHAKTRTLVLRQKNREDGFPVISTLDGKRWSDPVAELPVAGSTEIWEFINTTEDTHPIHIHLVHFQVLDRTPFDDEDFIEFARLQFTGPAEPPEPGEARAWKDTVRATSGYVTRVIARFDVPPDAKTTSGQRLRYIWHCHMLEHEDNEMMRPYDVVIP